VKKKLKKSMFLVVSLVAVILIQAPANAWSGRESHSSGHRSHNTHRDNPAIFANDFFRIVVDGLKTNQYRYTFHGVNRNCYVAVPVPVSIGSIVSTPPYGCQRVIINGITYYTYDGVTYQYTPRGYMVVPDPATVAINDYKSAQDIYANSGNGYLIVNVPNCRGGYTAVTMKRSGNGFIGPQNEYYTEFPKIETLSTLYGK